MTNDCGSTIEENKVYFEKVPVMLSHDMTAKNNVSLAQRAVFYIFICFLSTNAVAQAVQTAPAQNTTVHIVAEVRMLTGEPLKGMRSADFNVSSAGIPLRLQMSTFKIPSPNSVLVILSTASGFDSLLNAANYLCNSVPSAIQSRYLMSFLGPHGEYIDLQPAHDALNMLRSGTFHYENSLQAVYDLTKSKGPRAIVYMTNRLANPPIPLISAAQEAGALIYAVGGNEYQNYVYSGLETTSGPLGNFSEGLQSGPVLSAGPAGSPVSNAVVWESYANQSIRTVYMERSIQKAFQQMAKASLGRYWLTVDVPASTQTIQLGTKLSGDYQIDAYAYTDSDTPAPKLILSTSKR
jgi:hypothetical protein